MRPCGPGAKGRERGPAVGQGQRREGENGRGVGWWYWVVVLGDGRWALSGDKGWYLVMVLGEVIGIG